MNICLAQINPIVGNPEFNAIRIIQHLEIAKKKEAEFVLFGELSLTGYYAQDQFFNDFFLEKVESALKMILFAAKKLELGFALGLPRRNPNQSKGEKHLLNSLYIYNPSSEYCFQDKILIPTYAEFDEYRWFQSGNLENIIIHKIGTNNIGFVLCEDGWNNRVGIPDNQYRLYDQDPIQHLINLSQKQERPLSAIINISASPNYVGKQQQRLEMNSKIANHYKTPIIFLNLVGGQDELIFGGQSFVLNNKGQIVKTFQAFEEDIQILNLTTINQLPFILHSQSTIPHMSELDGLMGLYLKDYFKKSRLLIDDKPLTLKEQLFVDIKKAEAIIKPFQQQNKTAKVILGLSGGKDSTAVAVILKRHLGAKNVVGVMMPYRYGEYTQPKSKKLATKLAKKLGIEVREYSIENTTDSLLKQLNVKETSLAHQNLQARLRATILWTIANKEGFTVINTTNFSEAAMGYGTIGGDLLGLPLIASLPATTIIKYLSWLKEDQKETAITSDMIHRPPSAELAPGQLDAKELGEYSYIDPIIESLRMNFGDLNKVVQQFTSNIKENHIYTGTPENKEVFKKHLTNLAKKLLIYSEFKRWYYFKTPQFTPFSWLRWKWPIANGYFDIDLYLEELLNE